MKRDGHSEAAQVAFLLHDAHEAYIGDIATPVAAALEAMADESLDWDGRNPVRMAIRNLKYRLDCAIYSAAGLPVPLDPPTREIIHEYDRRMCATEHKHRCAPLPRPYPYLTEAVQVEGCDLWYWSAGTVEKCYLAALKEYGVMK